LNEQDRDYWIIVCSDSVGETAEAVVRATIRQFQDNRVKIKRFAHLANEDDIRMVVREAQEKHAFVAFTLVQPELREMMKKESIRMGVRTVDIMGPMMQAFIDRWKNPASCIGWTKIISAASKRSNSRSNTTTAEIPAASCRRKSC